MIKEIADPISNQGWPASVQQSLAEVPTDVQAIQDGYISITPLQYNLTSVTGLEQVMPKLTNLAFGAAS